MRVLKYKVGRKTMNQVYISYMRPILEYASTVWDGCTVGERNSLEQLQYEAARIVTGLTRSVSINKLIVEIGWLSLADRRTFQKLITVFKAKNKMLPESVNNLFPPFVRDINNYNLWNSDDYVTPIRRTELFSKSFIPSSLSLCNNLPTHVRELVSLKAFKCGLLNTMFKRPTVRRFIYAVHDHFL